MGYDHNKNVQYFSIEERSSQDNMRSNICFCIFQQYLYCLKELYHAGLEEVDFAKATEKVREQINSWVESETNGRDVMHVLDRYPPRTGETVASIEYQY